MAPLAKESHSTHHAGVTRPLIRGVVCLLPLTSRRSTLPWLYRAINGTLCHMVTPDRMTQVRKGVLEYCVLALLRSESRYGFDLVRSLSDLDGLVTSEGTIYPLLARLRKEGVVDSTWQESQHGPPRRYYRLTPKGVRALEDFRKDWRRFRESVDQVMEDK